MDFQEVGWQGEAWIDLDQDRDRWRALVNAVIKFCVHKMWGRAENFLDPHEVLYCIDLVF
jgi:hypothetical protein